MQLPSNQSRRVLLQWTPYCCVMERVYLETAHLSQYCDKSTHCWVTQQRMQPASKRQVGKQISAQARWRHTAVVGECHVLTWLLRDIPRWCYIAPGVGNVTWHDVMTQQYCWLRRLRRCPIRSNMTRTSEFQEVSSRSRKLAESFISVSTAYRNNQGGVFETVRVRRVKM
jgi:hypothetical protein